MRKLLIPAIAITGVLFTADAASAETPFNEHNCAGVVVSGLADTGFGEGVVDLALLRGVDNLGLRNCGQAEGQNP